MSPKENPTDEFNFCFPVPDVLESERVVLTPFRVSHPCLLEWETTFILIYYSNPNYIWHLGIKTCEALCRRDPSIPRELWLPTFRAFQRFRWLRENIHRNPCIPQPRKLTICCVGQDKAAFFRGIRISRSFRRPHRFLQQLPDQPLHRGRLRLDLTTFPSDTCQLERSWFAFAICLKPALPTTRRFRTSTRSMASQRSERGQYPFGRENAIPARGYTEMGQSVTWEQSHIRSREWD